MTSFTPRRLQRAVEIYLTKQAAVREWIEQSIGKPFPLDATTMELLGDGTLLVKLANAFRSPALSALKVTEVPSEKLSYLRVENLHRFLKACKEDFGLRDCDLFQPIDLMENKNPVRVIHCLHTLGTTLGHPAFNTQHILASARRTFTSKEIIEAQEAVRSSLEIEPTASTLISDLTPSADESLELLLPRPRRLDFSDECTVLPTDPIAVQSTHPHHKDDTARVLRVVSGWLPFVASQCVVLLGWWWLWQQNQLSLL